MLQRTPGGMIIVLNGFPGVGKYTILKEVQALLPADKSPRLIDNHLLIDPAAALYPGRGVHHHELRHAIRGVFFPYVSRLAQEGHVVLMTACLAADNDRDATAFQEHLDLVRGIDVPLYWINAYCDQVSLMQRVQSNERIHSSKSKLTDASMLQELLNAHTLIEPQELNDASTKLVVRTLDTSGEIGESVNRLLAIVGLQRGVESASGQIPKTRLNLQYPR
jgi:predicted kinase